MISVVITARNDKYLPMTLRSIKACTALPLEFVVVLDGPGDYSLPNYPNLRVIRHASPQGIRVSLNRAVSESDGDYILKLDSHCIVDTGFVDTLLRDYQDKTVMVARRYTLDLTEMKPVPRPVDYFYLSCPWTYPRGFLMMQSCPWISHESDKVVDDLMCFQGSMWFMGREHWDWLGGLETNMQFVEHHEISFKTWLGGRTVLTNKATWYAHPKQAVGGYRMDMEQVYKDHEQSALYWTNNFWQSQVYDFGWLISKFWPLPTASKHHRLEKYTWPEDWKMYAN